jgi:hypothetical protein
MNTQQRHSLQTAMAAVLGMKAASVVIKVQSINSTAVY